jgi:hypothetical protein
MYNDKNSVNFFIAVSHLTAFEFGKASIRLADKVLMPDPFSGKPELASPA